MKSGYFFLCKFSYFESLSCRCDVYHVWFIKILLVHLIITFTSTFSVLFLNSSAQENSNNKTILTRNSKLFIVSYNVYNSMWTESHSQNVFSCVFFYNMYFFQIEQSAAICCLNSWLQYQWWILNCIILKVPDYSAPQTVLILV